MPSCLGLYVESNIIKYAKVSKDRDIVKVESFGIKFYDNLGSAIKQIISETYSFKIPVSINLADEVYNYFYMFSMLNKKDLKSAIQTEYESYCIEKGLNPNASETRYALVNSVTDKDKIKVINISVSKNNINAIEQQLSECKIASITPIGMAIANIAELDPKENIAIINMEEQTTVTIVTSQKVYSIDKIELGAKNVLDNINLKENSYSKAYEICKNTTIYTMEGKDLQELENEYLDDIMPTLYQIAQSVQAILSQSTIKISKIYLTGTLSVVNNIDLYFQEFFNIEQCEVLKPFFLKDTMKINIKDYIEVNSAIAIAMQGVGFGIKNMNFTKHTHSLPDWMTVEIGSPNSGSQISKGLQGLFRFDLGEKLDTGERWMLRVAAGILALVIIYSGFSIFINNQLQDKKEEASEVKFDTEYQIAKITSDINKVREKTNEYISLSDNLRDTSEQIQENQKIKNAIPTLLSEIMYVIPKDVQLLSIENTTGTHIVINAQSELYEQLGYLKVKIGTENILTNVASSMGTKDGDMVKIVIEGDLP